jgi:ATP-dependent Clp protease protease subunit
MVKKLAQSLFIIALLLPIGLMSAPQAPDVVVPQHIVISRDNSIFIVQEVSYETMSRAQQEFLDLVLRRKPNDPIYIVLDTPGGSVEAGMRFYETVKPYKNVHTITLRSYSMGALLVQAIPGQRLMVETGDLMFHHIKAGFQGYMTQADLEKQLAAFRAIELKMALIATSRSKLTIAQYTAKIVDDWFLSVDEAIKFGLIDKEVTVECTPALIAEKVQVESIVHPMLPPVVIERSACPLIL